MSPPDFNSIVADVAVAVAVVAVDDDAGDDHDIGVGGRRRWRENVLTSEKNECILNVSSYYHAVRCIFNLFTNNTIIAIAVVMRIQIRRLDYISLKFHWL